MVPVQNEAASDARNHTALATSRGVPMRFIGVKETQVSSQELGRPAPACVSSVAKPMFTYAANVSLNVHRGAR